MGATPSPKVGSQSAAVEVMPKAAMPSRLGAVEVTPRAAVPPLGGTAAVALRGAATAARVVRALEVGSQSVAGAVMPAASEDRRHPGTSLRRPSAKSIVAGMSCIGARYSSDFRPSCPFDDLDPHRDHPIPNHAEPPCCGHREVD